MKLRMKTYRKNRSNHPVKFSVDKLKDPEIKTAFKIETNNRFSALLKEWSAVEKCPDELWEDMKGVWTAVAKEKLGENRRKPAKTYISDEVIELARKKSQARKTNKTEEYMSLKKEIQTKIRRDKKEWLEKECAKINECNIDRKSREMFKQIRKIGATKFKPQNQCVCSKDGETLSDTNDILARWHEYGKMLFQSSRSSTTTNMFSQYEGQEKEPEPSPEEIRAAIKQLKIGKSPGLDNITGELLKHTGEAGINALHHLCCTIWRTCSWPSDWKLQEFVMLHKNGNAKDCGNYRTIALISHASKVLLIILLNRLKPKIEQEISECQAGYRSNRGTSDMLFILQILIEKIRNSSEEAFITFIDYSKAFDSVIHSHLFNTMVKMGFPKHLIALLDSLYTNQKATIRWNSNHSDYFNIEKGVRQGCILSPYLFNIYTEQIMREAEIEDMGVKIGGQNITNLRYADDTALMSDNITSMKRILYRVDTAGKTAGLNLNAKKTKVMHIGKYGTPPEIKINGIPLENVPDFKYLGSLKTEDGSCSKDIKTRIAMAKQKMVQLSNLWKDRDIPSKLKIKLLKCLVWPVMIYGSEAWTLKKTDKSKIEAAEMWFYRRLLRVSWTDKRTNESVLNELATTCQLLTYLNKRKLNYVGHAIRNGKTNLMASVFQGKINASRKKGRPPISYIDNIKEISGLRLGEVAQKSRDRETWRKVVRASSVAANIGSDDADR